MIKRTCKATEEERAQQKRQRPFCASSELTTYELRDRDVSCGAAPTLCCCLQHSSGFGGANMVLPLSLNPAPLEQGAELRLWARSPGCCQSAAAAWIQHGNAALAAAALMRGMEKKKKIFLFNSCITEGGDLGEGSHCTASCLAGERSLLGHSFLEKLKPRHYPA